MTTIDAPLLPDLCSAGPALVVSARYPPQPGGSSVVMYNLLANFNPRSYAIATGRGVERLHTDGQTAIQLHYMSSSLQFSNRLNDIWQDMQQLSLVSKLARLAQYIEPAIIIGVYPDYHFLAAARQVARELSIPWVAYLHDTIAEGLSRTRLAKRAQQLQDQVFAEAASILVMSQGMVELYQHKYSLSCDSLQHVYPEPIPAQIPDVATLSQAFWSGTIYEINVNSVRRVSAALASIGRSFLLSGSVMPRNLQQQDIAGSHLRTTFFPERADYLNSVRQQGVLVLALDWPDESPIHEDELATIFPTKAPEYLAAGRPILVHCPDHYFLARFFQLNQCGLVVSERSVEALAEAMAFLLEDNSVVRSMRQLSLDTAHQFAPELATATLQRVLGAIVNPQRPNKMESSR